MRLTPTTADARGDADLPADNARQASYVFSVAQSCTLSVSPQIVARYLFSVLDARVAGARRLRRFRVAQTRDVTEKPRLRKSLTVKRPESRAPVQIVVGR
jgi:hypothetical protein